MTTDYKVWMQVERRGEDDDYHNEGEPVSVGIFNTYEDAEAHMLRIAAAQPGNDLSPQELARIPARPPCADYDDHYTLGDVELACPAQQEDIDTYQEPTS